MKRFISFFAKTVLFLAFLSIFGWMVQHITKGDKNFGFFQKPIQELSSFPDLFVQSAKEVASLPGTFVKTAADFKGVNKLENDLNILSSYTNAENERTVVLKNLKNDEVLYSWEIDNPHADHARIMDPIMFEDKSLCYSFNGVTGLRKIDSTGNLIWKQDSIAHHHSMNLDSSGNIWACSYTKDNQGFIVYRGKYKVDANPVHFIDNTISKIDSKTGKLLYHKSITEILMENNLEYLYIQSDRKEDPLHINDVQPALKSTEFYDEGDVFISSRNLSSILHFRPKTNELVKLIQGPFSSQHDVDFLNDSTLVFFNNNSYNVGGFPGVNWPIAKELLEIGDKYSFIYHYNLKTGEFSPAEKEVFAENQIFTFTEGMQEYLPDGSIFIEEQNSGVLWVLKNHEVIYKAVHPSHEEGYHHLPNWIKVIK
jgi:hypothetical protein